MNLKVFQFFSKALLYSNKKLDLRSLTACLHVFFPIFHSETFSIYIFFLFKSYFKRPSHKLYTFCYRYLTDGASCLKKVSNMLKTRYEELINAMDMVGFTDEVIISNVP